ncbi:MAG: RNA polymerase sigma factor [Polyangiaceae bacterium]
MTTDRGALDRIYREERARIVATLIRVVGDFQVAEEIVQDAFASALEQWPEDGAPANAAGWLVQTARHKAIDLVRRRRSLDRKLADLATIAAIEESFTPAGAPTEALPMPDDRLRLIFTCCHPALAIEARIALTLRTLGGLSTEEIARAFLAQEATMAQRIVRAKNKIREAKIPYEVPGESAIAERTSAVMTVLYLIFSEGYAPTKGDALVRVDLATEAIHLTRMLLHLLPSAHEPEGLLALMLLQHSRRDARATPEGDLVLLEDQDRSRWDRDAITEGLVRVEAALRRAAGRPGAFALQAAIAACHARAERASDTDWAQIARLYDHLFAATPTPVVALNRVVARAMVHGFDVGLRELDDLLGADELAGYHLFHAARADFLRRLGKSADARAAYQRALELALAEPERRFLARRLRELAS